jgi:hypothetical protein
MSSTVQPRFEHVWPTAPGNPPILMGPCSSAPDSHLASQLETDGTPDFKIYHYYNGFTAQFAKPRAIHSALESSLSQCSKLRVYWLGGIWSRHLCLAAVVGLMDLGESRSNLKSRAGCLAWAQTAASLAFFRSKSVITIIFVLSGESTRPAQLIHAI